ncbi:hypothetical protein AVEN_115221-1 [Araneus ventricosus]|uniref:Uncharacterized protein n=1 Tax=Araneus ventricosus TaxID=182803 RepID=A0A4Y1ZY99_ARAVE|nr:hypothetical protein AVEN_115221-1 [Araneus ventricosus]
MTDLKLYKGYFEKDLVMFNRGGHLSWCQPGKGTKKHGVNAFSQNEIEHFECCDDDVIISGEVSEEDIVALVNEKNNSIVDSSSDMEEEQDEPGPSIPDAKAAANVLNNFFHRKHRRTCCGPV